MPRKDKVLALTGRGESNEMDIADGTSHYPLKEGDPLVPGCAMLSQSTQRLPKPRDQFPRGESMLVRESVALPSRTSVTLGRVRCSVVWIVPPAQKSNKVTAIPSHQMPVAGSIIRQLSSQSVAKAENLAHRDVSNT